MIRYAHNFFMGVLEKCTLPYRYYMIHRPTHKNTQHRAILGALAFIYVLFSLIQSSFATVAQKDFKVITRSIGFMQGLSKGQEDFAIVYNPSIQSSVNEAENFKNMLEKKKSIKGLKLIPRFVPVQHLSEIRQARFVFVTDSLAPHHAQIYNAAAKNDALSITLDRNCVINGHCILYVNTEHRVDITVHKAAAEKSNIKFEPVFMVMVTTL